MDKKVFTDQLIKSQLLQATARKRFYNAKQFYWDCILSYGDKYYDSQLKPESEVQKTDYSKNGLRMIFTNGNSKIVPIKFNIIIVVIK